MDRRSFVLGTGASLISSKLYAKQDTVGNLQRAYVAHPQLIVQECAEWCWAASSSMIFAAHGHPVDQMKIVDRLFHTVVCEPAYSTKNITQTLSEPWVDDNGQSFSPRVVAAYDSANGKNSLSNQMLIEELANDRPVLYCNKQHAMVVVDINYFMGPGGVIIPQQVGVLDPWPGNGYRLLSPAEMAADLMGGQMTYLASVAV